MYCEKCGTKLHEEQKFCASCGASTSSSGQAATTTATEYLAMPPGRLWLFCVLTWGIYELYWFYKNWQAVKRSQLPHIWPVPRSIFAIFFCYDLFKRVYESAKSNGYAESFSAQWLATGYIVMLIVQAIWNKMEYLGALDILIAAFVLSVTPLPLLSVQRAINFNNAKIGAHTQFDKKFTGGEVAIIVIGILFMLLAIWGFLPE